MLKVIEFQAVICWVLILSVTKCLAQIPTPCDPPSQLTFRAITYDHEYTTINRYRGSYDAETNRLAFYEETSYTTPGKQYFHLIYLFDEGIAYEINLTTQKCVKAPSGKFTKWGIPTNATFEDDYIYGGPNDGLEIMQWSDKIPTRRATWLGMYTKKDCFPVSTMIYDPSDVQRSATYNIYDIALGIDNPKDFIPPAQCSPFKSKVPIKSDMQRHQLAELFVARH